MPTTSAPTKSSRRKKEVAEELAVKRWSERVAAELTSGISGSGPTITRLAGQEPAEVSAGAHSSADDSTSPDALEAAALLQRISADLAVEEALVAQLMKQHGL